LPKEGKQKIFGTTKVESKQALDDLKLKYGELITSSPNFNLSYFSNLFSISINVG